jgi:hypothetical protein
MLAFVALDERLEPWRKADPYGFEAARTRALEVVRAGAGRVEPSGSSSTTAAEQSAFPVETVEIVGTREPDTMTPVAEEPVEAAREQDELNAPAEPVLSSEAPAAKCAEPDRARVAKAETRSKAKARRAKPAPSQKRGRRASTSQRRPSKQLEERTGKSRAKRVTKAKPREKGADEVRLRARLAAALAAGHSQRGVARTLEVSQSQISRFVAGYGLAEDTRKVLAAWLRRRRF